MARRKDLGNNNKSILFCKSAINMGKGKNQKKNDATGASSAFSPSAFAPAPADNAETTSTAITSQVNNMAIGEHDDEESYPKSVIKRLIALKQLQVSLIFDF
jgi:hypothetical protein